MSPARRSGPGSEARARLLDAALRLMARHGEEGTSVQMLGAELGLHKTIVFHHFADKRALARAVFDDVTSRLLPLFEALESGPPTVDQLEAWAGALADHYGTYPDEAAFLMRAMVAPESSSFAVDPSDRDHPVARMLAILTAWLRRARRAGVVRPVRAEQVILHLLGLLLFPPAAAEHLPALAGSAPFARAARAARRAELLAFVRAGLRR